LYLFCKRITLHHPEQFASKKPFLIGAHHPNSFFDAILTGAFMHLPVHFLTRSDVFTKGWVRYLLSKMKMIPVYRIRDGKDKLSLNDASFQLSCDALKKGDHVLIFIEGFCNYQTTLQPLKKGAARIVLQSWQQGIEVSLMPLWIRYDSFFHFGKEIDLIPGKPIGKEVITEALQPSNDLQQLNRAAEQQLLELAAIPSPAYVTLLNRHLIFPFALAGFLLHAPFYFLIRAFVSRLTKGSIHYDSLLFCLLAFLYPFWILIFILSFHTILEWYWLLLLVGSLPILGRAFVVWKK
jgi:1-acyl-sn-glycerol-3-phosphate acyltransferase